jgi:hypothetical protein
MLNSLSLQLLRAFCWTPYRRFHKSLAQPAVAQHKLFTKLVSKLAGTGYGAEHRIEGTESYEEFARKIPMRDYDAIHPWINSLTNEKIVHVEPTSGSSGAVKQIPYTASLLHDFSAMFAIWAYDVLAHGPKLRKGRIFISTSSAEGQLGFESDHQYLRQPLRSLISPFMVPSLWDAEDVEVISVWSPSYLLSMLDQVQGDWKSLWPNLKLISCWDNGASRSLALALRSKFPGVEVQGKGLLSTEAPITVPLIEAGGCVPLVDHVFMEFESEDGSVMLLDQLEKGKQYELIITQSAGLTRYRTHDIVAVTRFYKTTPVLEFIGRANQTCDLVGEKLEEKFVRQALREFAPFILLPDGDRYTMLTSHPISPEGADKLLCTSHHYRLARQLYQLRCVENIVVSNVSETMSIFLQSQGMKEGDIKDTCLFTDASRAQKLLSRLRQRAVNQSIHPYPAYPLPFQSPVDPSKI